MELIPTIGLEIHVELNTRTKMFCDSPNDPDETRPNVNVCPVCLAHPGTLPTINRQAVRKVLEVGLAIGGEISPQSHFERKNYFYPDLPKGYQISQYQVPLARGGYLEIGSRKIRIRRVHLEEDTGRLVHLTGNSHSRTLVDFNRAGIPLMELVTEPDLTSAEEARSFAEELQLILQYLGVSEANMEKGEMRIEANVSLAPADSPALGTKVELKNINSFRFMERAIDYELERQREMLERGQEVKPETRGWDERRGETLPQRGKEESPDYRYFPEPDLPPLLIAEEEIETIRAALPELHFEKERRFVEEFEIPVKIARTIAASKPLAAFFEDAVSELKEWLASTGRASRDPKATQLAANYLTTDFLKLLADARVTIEECRIRPEDFAELLTYILEEKISSATAKQVLKEMFSTGADPSAIIEEKNLWQVSDKASIEAAAERTLRMHQAAAADFKKGKTEVLQFLVGQVMKEMRGANPEMVRQILEEKLKRN